MTAQWKPGDVAMVGYRIYEDSDLVEDVRMLGVDNKWRGAHGWVANDPAAALSIRPILTIDPDSDADVARLCDAYKSVDHAVGAMPMQAALRSLIAPPKPDEPTGLGAVIEDAAGVRWVRVDGEYGDPWIQPGEAGGVREYRDITAVRVLSEGIEVSS